MGFNPQVNITLIEDDVPEAAQWIKDLEEYRQMAQNRLEAIQNMRDGHKDVKFEEGDQVWLEAKNLPLKGTQKLMPKWYGPFTIEKQISPVAFQLTLPPSMKIHNVFHADLLLPYKETEEYGQPYMHPPPVIEEGEEDYEINAILDARRFGRGQKLQYLMHWKGYPNLDNSWINHKDMNAKELLKEYYSTVAGQTDV
jgi:hypothetical protein